MDGGDAFWFGRSVGGADKRVPIIDPIMLRFRPIAPKPPTGGPASGAGELPESKSWLAVKRRAKRRYVRVRKNNSQCKRRGRSQAGGHSRGKPVLTLQLLPEQAEPRESMASGVPLDLVPMIIAPREVYQPDRDRPLKFNVDVANWGDPTVLNPLKRAVAVSWLTVERVGVDPCMGVVGEFFAGSTDDEKIKNLRSDTCPGLVSDFQNRVHWVNNAYVWFASGESRGEVEPGPHRPPAPEVEVRLVAKERLPTCQRAFTCHVTWRDERWTTARTVPCDVWRLDGFGGFAWRLDVKAALGLGF
ncbi:hypothetical protein BT93_I1123 [Corymbia citriodora subsp. variegata]|nr:hypothetical protein BT93_I1123 [Corymbia citriodora subsp. variegata]